jgi:hypothetical protein
MEVDLILDGSSNEVKISKYNKYKWNENINRLKLINIYAIFLLIPVFLFIILFDLFQKNQINKMIFQIIRRMVKFEKGDKNIERFNKALRK